jgi:hypothetical protein
MVNHLLKDKEKDKHEADLTLKDTVSYVCMYTDVTQVCIGGDVCVCKDSQTAWGQGRG